MFGVVPTKIVVVINPNTAPLVEGRMIALDWLASFSFSGRQSRSMVLCYPNRYQTSGRRPNSGRALVAETVAFQAKASHDMHARKDKAMVIWVN